MRLWSGCDGGHGLEPEPLDEPGHVGVSVVGVDGTQLETDPGIHAEGVGNDGGEEVVPEDYGGPADEALVGAKWSWRWRCSRVRSWRGVT